MIDNEKLYKKLIEAGWHSYKIRKDPVASKLISQSALTRIRQNQGNVSIETLEGISKLLNVQPLELLDGLWEIDLQPTKKQEKEQCLDL